MGEGSGLPRINEVAAYLERFAPQTSAELTSSDPRLTDLLNPGMLAGETEADEDAADEELVARATIVSAALRDAVDGARLDAKSVSSRLARLRRTRFVAQVLGAIGSCGVLATISSSQAAAIVSGTLALASTVAGLAADTLILGSKGNEEKLREILATLAKVGGQGALTHKLLAGLASDRTRADQVKLLLSEANALFADLIEARAAVEAMS